MHTELATVPVFTLQHHSRQPGDCSRSATHSTDRIEMTKLLTLLFMAICVSASAAASETDASRVVGRIHPKLFEMVTSWDSDTEQPVVTEINLDAVVKNRNQFDFSEVKKNGDWIECAGDDGGGFSRFKTIKSDKTRFLIEFQRNAGGTLTMGALIEFVVETREVLKAGKAHPIQVLRVISIEAK